jgi:hypothetical protein
MKRAFLVGLVVAGATLVCAGSLRAQAQISAWYVVAPHGGAELVTSVADNFVEPRAQGLRKLRVEFSGAINAATVNTGSVSVWGDTSGNLADRVASVTLLADNRTLEVALTQALPNAERFTVRASNALRGADGNAITGDQDRRLATLIGDADGSGRVTAADVLAVRGQAGQAVSGTNGRYDLDGSNAITGGDMMAVRDRLGSQLPVIEDNFQIEVTTTTSPQNFICRFVITTPGAGRTLHVDWGDGSANDYAATGNVTHAYATGGKYTVRMSGYVNLIDFFIYPDPGLGTPRLISAIKTPIRGITGLNSAYEMFKHCENIPSIPVGLFDNCPGITRFYDTFLACKKITAIPPGLFDYQTNVTDFYATFDNCDLLKEIPPGLFDKHPNNTNFAWTFAKCYSLESIPAGLFDRHTRVTTFAYCFFRCWKLRSIPPLLFDRNTSVTTYANAFEDCGRDQVPPRLTGSSPANSAGLKLWELSPLPTGTRCFYNCTGLTDYATIPTNWR